MGQKMHPKQQRELKKLSKNAVAHSKHRKLQTFKQRMRLVKSAFVINFFLMIALILIFAGVIDEKNTVSFEFEIRDDHRVDSLKQINDSINHEHQIMSLDFDALKKESRIK